MLGFVLSTLPLESIGLRLEPTGFFLFHENTPSLGELIEVNLVAVKVRAVNTGELHLPANGNPTGSAHAGSVYHNRIEAYECRDIVSLG
jgi:hypothetical protein